MTVIVVDVETDGPIPYEYSMISFGAVIVDNDLNKTFYGKLKPISNKWIPEALSVSGFSREETMSFEEPIKVMEDFASWIATHSKSRPLFFSDNNGFDWQFVNWYFHYFTGNNPFGFSSNNIGSLYKGMVSDMFKSFKHLRRTKHTHNPVDDALGNAEALLYMKSEMGLKLSLK